MDFDQPIRVKRGQRKSLAMNIAREIIDKYEPVLLRRYIRRLDLDPKDGERVRLLAEELLCPSEDDGLSERYRSQRLELLAAPIEERLSGVDFIIPAGALNFLCEGYRCELRTVCLAAAELIEEERHGDMCCLIAGEYIEKRMHRLGSKLIAVHLVIDGDNVELYDGARREITEQYSAYLPYEDRRRYSHSDLVLSAMVDIAPRSIYVYGGESNFKLLRRLQLMFTGVHPVDGKLEVTNHGQRPVRIER